MSEGSSFKCNVSEMEYYINSKYTCDSSCVVYLLGCKVCGKQYVGSTFTSFRATMSAKSSWNACTVLRVLYPRPVSEALTRV